jgi:predicted RNase H-like HicB family nuclease
MRYPALIEGGGGHYGVVFPDIPGVASMGHSVDEAIANASEVLSDYAIEMERDGLPLAAPSALEDVEVPEGCALTSILLVRESRDKPSVRLNLVLDAGVADAITSEARRRGMSRKSYIEWMTKTIARMGA